MERWSTDIHDWTKLTKDSASFYMSQAEARLKSTEDTSNILVASNDRLLGITTTLLSVSIGYLFTGSELFLQTTAFFIILFCAGSGYYLFQNLREYNIFTGGEEPKLIFTSPFVENEYSPEQQYLNLVFQMMETIQYKIDQNKITNQLRRRRIGRAKQIMLFSPLAFLFASVYLHLLGFHLVWTR